MIAAIITIDLIIGAACVAGLVLLVYLLRRDRGLIWHRGDPLPDVRMDAPARRWKSASQPDSAAPASGLTIR
jgi:hypothetical protein